MINTEEKLKYRYILIFAAVLVLQIILALACWGGNDESQKQAAISEIRQQVATLSVEISEKVLRQKLGTDKAQMDYINQML